MMKIPINNLIAICSLLTNIIALILSFLSYKESKSRSLLTARTIFMYKVYVRVTSIRFYDMYILYAIIIVCYTT